MGSVEAAQARILATTPHEKANIQFRWRPFLDGITVLLAVASIIFAYVQKLDSRELKNKTEFILGSVTTGYIAEFPKSIPAITTILQGACADLSIMVDLPGYGQYSNPDAFYSYMHSIVGQKHTTVKSNFDAGHCIGKSFSRGQDLMEKPKVRLLLFSPDEREVNLRRQLTLDSLKAGLSDDRDPSTRNKVLNFLNANADLLHEKPEEFLAKLQAGTGYEQFIGLLLATQHDSEKEFKKAGIDIRYARQSSIMRMWIEDADEAAFSFDHSSETEIAFRTRDPKLLDNFKKIFDQHWGNAVCYEDYWDAKEKNPAVKMDDLKACQ
jgi:hypothetical protein